MLQFILTNILMLSVGLVMYLMARALPRIVDDPAGERPPTYFERLVNSELPNKIDEALNFWLGKVFRRLKVTSLRFDNYLTERLKKINIEASAKPKIDFAEVVASATETAEEQEAESAAPLFPATNGNGKGKK